MIKQDNPVHIFDGIHWVGAQNPSLRRFDVVMETEYGTSYNAYLVMGAEKTALIDTVKEGFLPQSLALIAQVVEPSAIDYIILQHTEPDHSGSIRALLEAAPNATILCSKPASLYLPQIANCSLPIEVVKDGDVLDLGGGRELQFLSTPFLHWPDTIMTYDTRSQALFSCDGFGCHYASPDVLESKTDPVFQQARRYYYDCIMKPFAPYVAKAVAHIKERNLPISAILPSHGPVLDADPAGAIELYAQWAQERPCLQGNQVFIGYVSCYGYTRRLAKRLHKRLQALGLVPELYDLSECSLPEAERIAANADAIAIGCPTVNADALPPVMDLLTRLSVPVMRGRVSAAFGSYGWSGEAVPQIEARLAALGMKAAAPGVKARFRPSASDYAQIEALADAIAGALRK